MSNVASENINYEVRRKVVFIMADPVEPDAEDEFCGQISRLTIEVRELREFLQGLRLQQYISTILSTRRLAAVGFLVGILNGLGAAIGATIALALLIFILSKLEVVPHIGRFVSEVVRIVQQQQHK